MSAASGLDVVTMFQPERPLLMWSSEAKRRAMWYGASKVVEPVATSPICVVACDSADSKVKGSNDVTVWLRLSASIGMFNTAMWSAMKNASNLARSSVWIDCLMRSKLKFMSGQAPG